MASDIPLTELHRRLVDATPQYDDSMSWDEDRAQVEFKWQSIIEREWREKELLVHVAHRGTGEPMLVSPTPERKIFWHEGARLDGCAVGSAKHGALLYNPFTTEDEFARLKARYLELPISAMLATDQAADISALAPKTRKGPIKGTVRRYDEAYAALIPEMERLMREQKVSRTAAALKLAEADRVPGTGMPSSRAKALLKFCRSQKERAGTR
jgi:hypothetical protein